VILIDEARHLDYNLSMSDQHPEGLKMYAELGRKVCRICKTEKDRSEFSSFKKGNKHYARPFCKACKTEGNFEWDLWKNYRIRLPEYLELYKAQEGNCACCGTHESMFKRKLHVDHDHETGQIRGLLCTRCNPAIRIFAGFNRTSINGGRIFKEVQEVEDKKPLR
jgi:Recombination endonuclease VII